MAALVGQAVKAFSTQLQRHPWRTQIVTTGALWALGDAIAQRVERAPFDARRNMLAAGYGASFVGPLGHAWYMALDKGARAVFRPGSAAFVAGKVVADTAVMGPLHVAGFFAVMTLLHERGSWADVRAKLARDFWPTFSADLALWPAAVNFRFVPVQYHLLVVNCFTILDSCFLSWTAANDGWFQRLFPGLAQQFGMDMEPAAAGKAGKAHGAAKAAVAASPAPSSRKGGA